MCALRCLHPLTELGSHLTVVPEVVAEPGVPANAALVVAATLKVQLVGSLKQRVQLNRRRRGGSLSLGFAFAPPLARGSGLAFARSRAIAFLTSPLSFLAGRPAGSSAMAAGTLLAGSLGLREQALR